MINLQALLASCAGALDIAFLGSDDVTATDHSGNNETFYDLVSVGPYTLVAFTYVTNASISGSVAFTAASWGGVAADYILGADVVDASYSYCIGCGFALFTGALLGDLVLTFDDSAVVSCYATVITFENLQSTTPIDSDIDEDGTQQAGNGVTISSPGPGGIRLIVMNATYISGYDFGDLFVFSDSPGAYYYFNARHGVALDYGDNSDALGAFFDTYTSASVVAAISLR